MKRGFDSRTHMLYSLYTTPLGDIARSQGFSCRFGRACLVQEGASNLLKTGSFFSESSQIRLSQSVILTSNHVFTNKCYSFRHRQ
ncbi:uncharacterized protein [Montipora capricornis]|uniref:uncharacterized protein isoform X2 n=1 Tax=Montipora capricornis TaxID=246305 RepID=UPI0035F20430